MIEFLESRKKETLKMVDLLNDEFLNLSDALFYTKPNPDKWCIAECFNHLNLTLEIYIPQMRKVVNDKSKYIGQKPNFSYSVMGKLAINAMKPRQGKTIPYKMKTFKRLKPTYMDDGKSEILNRFQHYQEDILVVIDGLKDVDLKKPKLVTAAGPMLKMSIGDALHFMIAHNQRHILQAQNVLREIQ